MYELTTTRTNPPRRILYLVLAMVFLGLGVAGVFLPVLPATPFFLLMSYLLIRSSPSLHARVLRWPLVGNVLRDWQRHRGVRRRVKVKAAALVGCTLGLSIWLAEPGPITLAVLLALGAIGVVVVLLLPEARAK